MLSAYTLCITGTGLAWIHPGVAGGRRLCGSQSGTMNDPIFDALQVYLTDRFPGSTIENFSFVTSGWESNVYSFSLIIPTGKTNPWILRLFPGNGVEQKVANEANGLIRLSKEGYPVPDILLYETCATALGKPFSIVEKIEGQALWPHLKNTSLEETSRLLDRFCALMVELHRLDWRLFCADSTLYEANPLRILTDWSAAQRQMIQKFEVPGFLPVIDWLESHVPSGGIQPAVVHRDFHANNVFLHSNGSMTVIDWTQIGVFDYRADLSWTLLIMGDMGQQAWADRILREYKNQTGHPVESLDFFNVISYLKQLVDTVISLKSGMQAIGLNPVKSSNIEQEIPFLKLFSRRVANITGITIREVEHLIR